MALWIWKTPGKKSLKDIIFEFLFLHASIAEYILPKISLKLHLDWAKHYMSCSFSLQQNQKQRIKHRNSENRSNSKMVITVSDRSKVCKSVNHRCKYFGSICCYSIDPDTITKQWWHFVPPCTISRPLTLDEEVWWFFIIVSNIATVYTMMHKYSIVSGHPWDPEGEIPYFLTIF